MRSAIVLAVLLVLYVVTICSLSYWSGVKSGRSDAIFYGIEIERDARNWCWENYHHPKQDSLWDARMDSAKAAWLVYLTPKPWEVLW